MRIAILSPTVIETPPKEYGGIELLVGELAKELEKLNHKVTLFAKPGSYVPNGGLVECNSEEECSEKAFNDNFDIIHDWTHKKTSMNFSYFSNKIFSTPFYTDAKGLNPVYPSKIVANSFGENGPIVYPGIDISKYSFRKDKEDYFIYFGRIAPIKGIHIVITIAKRIGINLKVAGHEGNFAYDKEYIKMIKEMCSGKIEYIGSVSFNEKIDLLSHAKGFLFYPLWLESFGITVVESLLCIPKGTLILSNHKPLPIEKITTRHRVPGQCGIFQHVLRKYCRHYNGDIIEVKAVGLLPFSLTPNHPVLVGEVIKENKIYIEKFGKTLYRKRVIGHKWKRSDELKVGDYLIFPRLKTGCKKELYFRIIRNTSKLPSILDKFRRKTLFYKIRMSNELAELFGRYLADGWANISVGIAFNGDEIEEVKRYAEIVAKNFPYKPTIKKVKPTVIELHFGGPVLARFFRKFFGSSAHDKHIPSFMFHTHPCYIRAFLRGYLGGDGYISKRGDYLFTTVSKGLALGLQLLISRLGVFASIKIVKQPEKTKILGKEVNLAPFKYVIAIPKTRTYILQFGSKRRYGRYGRRGKRRVIETKDAFYVPITNIKKYKYNGKVFNMTTEDSTFTVSNIIVHNCGTPTIVRNWGGPAEQVEHEVSGYLCSSPNEMEEYIKKIDNILPENCRKRGEYFSSERMALEYLKIYGGKNENI